MKIKNYNWRAVGKEYVIRNNFQQSDYYEKEENNSYTTATDLKIGEKYNGTLNSNSDKDFWKITATKKGYIKLSFGHDYIDDYHGWNVYVYQYVMVNIKN